MPQWVYKRLFILALPCMNRKSRLFHKLKMFSFVENLSCRHSKQPFSTLHLPFPPSHNLLSAKNTAVLLQSALNPYAVTPEPRTDSKPFRRQFARKAGFGSCCRKLYQNYFRQSFESRSQDGVPCAFYVTFCTMQKVTSRSPAQEASRFCEPRFSTQNKNFAQTQLNPLPLRGFIGGFAASFPPCGGVPAGTVSILFVRHKKYAKKAFCPCRGI